MEKMTQTKSGGVIKNLPLFYSKRLTPLTVGFLKNKKQETQDESPREAIWFRNIFSVVF